MNSFLVLTDLMQKYISHNAGIVYFKNWRECSVKVHGARFDLERSGPSSWLVSCTRSYCGAVVPGSGVMSVARGRVIEVGELSVLLVMRAVRDEV